MRRGGPGREYGVVVEELTFAVAACDLEDWLAADRAAWDALLARSPGFLGKEVWAIGDPVTSVRVVIWWASLADQARVPDDAQDEAERRMGGLGRDPGSRNLSVLRRLEPSGGPAADPESH